MTDPSSRSRSWGEVARSRLAAGLSAVLVAAMLGGCGRVFPWSEQAECKSAEEAGYPKLEAVASQTLANVQHTLTHHSGCEERGVPDPSVAAQVPEWSQRQDIKSYLLAAGWTLDQYGYTSPDRKIMANTEVMTKRDGTKFGNIYFFAAP